MKWDPACEHLVEHHTEGVDIGAGINRLALCLLGRYIFGGAYNLVNAGERGIAGLCAMWRQCGLRVTVEKLGDTEVREQELRGVAGRDEHILGFDITMHDAAQVCVM